MTSNRKFRFGVAASAPPSTAAAWLDLARKVEDLGYSTLLVADHMSRQASPLIASAAALTATTSLRVGTQVLANPFRNPAVLAKEIATLDLLSDGRFEPGIGAGWPVSSPIGRSDSDQTGIEMGGSGERVGRMLETVQIVKRFCSSDEPFDYEGQYYELKGVIPSPRAVQRPHPPIMVAGAGPKMMRIAALEADIINIAPRPPIVGPTARGSMGFGMTMEDEVELIRAAAGERYEDLELCVFSNNPSAKNPSVTDDPDPLIEELARDLNADREATLAMPATLIGAAGALIERIQQDREHYDVTYRIIPEFAMEQFAPIVAALAGT
jgi:probable F420-dependent oxidoreductase